MVGKKVPSAVGLRDMHGNVSAWVADIFVANACAAALGVEMRLNHGLQLPRDDE
jgi:formylglycine-generating enzyme required for sulfatase activity